MTRDAVHPDDHRDNEACREQHQKAFEAVFADLPTFQGDCRGETQGCRQSYACPDETSQTRTARAVQIDEYNADDQSGFRALTQCNQEGRDHRASSSCNSVASNKNQFSASKSRSQGILPLPRALSAVTICAHVCIPRQPQNSPTWESSGEGSASSSAFGDNRL